MKERYLVTGNEAVSLPTIRESDGGLEGISILYMAAKGMLEVVGSPLMAPFVEIDGEAVPLTEFAWKRTRHWIPSFTARANEVQVEGTILAPVGERGFCYRLKAVNQGRKTHQVRYGLKGCWDKTLHSINESKLVDGEKHAYNSGWNHAFVMDMRAGVSLFAFAPIYTEQPEESRTRCIYSQGQDGTVSYCLYRESALEPDGDDAENFWFGLGFEEVAASTSAKEMLRQGFDKEYEKTCRWLAARERSTGDPKLDELLNMNMFFSFFFGSGVTLDTEELVLVTSRSPRYYVSAAYWDRDSLLWSFPAILMVDPPYAREMLGYVFGRQGRNVGIHSRFIDGTVLEPGFELDELCAPVLALAGYVRETGDRTVLTQPDILSGVERILCRLAEKKHPEFALYETMLQPTDDMHVYPYLTYDNVLVWRILTDLAELYEGIWDGKRCRRLSHMAEETRAAVAAHCVKEKDGKAIYAWSVDLEGNWDVYDEPPGSLLLLPFRGFCSPDDEIWKNTVAVIRREEYPYSFAGCPIAEIGCPHAPHPWVLSIANSLLSGNRDKAKEHLLRCVMDNGIACESVDEITGESATGDAFATCAGFLSYAINHAFGEGKPLA